ncbi:hypothetical protein CFC21_056960, partial [Triticum aestivum]
MLFILQ